MRYDKLLTPQEVAIAFGVSPKTIVRWRKAGKLKSSQTIGSRNHFWASDIERLLESEKVHPENGRDGYRIRLFGKGFWERGRE